MRHKSSRLPQSNAAPQTTTGSSDPDIDVVIAVHSASRPVRRAVESCRVEAFGPSIRVTIVCHNIPVQEIEQSIGTVTGLQLRYLHLDDGVHSPAGPKNAGLDAATGTFVCVLDSDDYLEPGALGHWHEKLVAEQADVVIAPVRHEAGAIIKTPRARACRVRNLDPVKDGLAYATAPRGLWRAGIGEVGETRYAPGLRTGEDLAAGLKIYFSGARLLFPKHGPAYVLGNSAEDRVTGRLMPLSDEFQAIGTLPDEWLQTLSLRQRKSIACKIARTSLIGAIRRRGPHHEWDSAELAGIQDAAGRLEAMAPDYRRALTAADSALLENALAASSRGALFQQAVKIHQHANLLSKVFTRNLRDNLDPESKIRQLFRSMLDRRS